MQLELVSPFAAPTETIWRRLESLAHPSYFGTWGWIENWLATVPRELVPQLAVLYDQGEIVGAGFLGRRRIVRHHVVASRAAYLNGTGHERYDELCVEHNQLLLDPRTAISLRRFVELLPADWDELFLPRVDRDTFSDLGVPPGFRVRIDRDEHSPFVDLERVRAAGDYTPLLSANTRGQIRRSFRQVGACELEVAQTLDEALAIYDELVALHGESWRARGEPGAFADPWFEQFHRRLIQQRFAAGEIQLVRLRAGGKTIGCLYNLVANGRVLFYQSGFASFDDGSIKPGYMCHADAILYCAAKGHAVYDFLGGNGRYKQSLATDDTRLVSLRVQRAHLRFALEDSVRTLRDAVRP